MTEVLPKGWIEIEIGKVASVVSGGTPQSSDETNFTKAGEGIAWVTPADLSGYKQKFIAFGGRDITEKGYSSSSVKLMPKGSILFSSRAPIGYVAIAANSICTNQGFKSFVFPKEILSDYAYYYLRTIKSIAESLSSGTTFKELSGGAAQKLPFLLPPLAEQQEIATRLDALLAQVDAIKARLDALPAILKRFRQAVLAAAVSGKLTEDWRGDKEFGVTTPLGNLAEDIRYGTSKKCENDKGNTAVLRIPNISKGTVSLDNLKYADFDEKELKALALQEGDLLIIRSNGSADLVGQAAIIQNKDIHCLYAGYLIRVRLNKSLVKPKYVLINLLSPQIRKTIEVQARSTSGVNNINSKELAALEVELPRLEEQTEIVNRVEQLFAFADQIEQQVQAAQTCVNQLTQSILAKAFKGELTADWRAAHPELISGENSAEALLEKIKATQTPAKPKRGSLKLAI